MKIENLTQLYKISLKNKKYSLIYITQNQFKRWILLTNRSPLNLNELYMDVSVTDRGWYTAVQIRHKFSFLLNNKDTQTKQQTEYTKQGWSWNSINSSKGSDKKLLKRFNFSSCHRLWNYRCYCSSLPLPSHVGFPTYVSIHCQTTSQFHITLKEKGEFTA